MTAPSRQAAPATYTPDVSLGVPPDVMGRAEPSRVGGPRARPPRGGRRDLRTPLLVGLLAFVLYVPGFWWGAPHATALEQTRAWAVDDETPLGPLAEVHNILHPAKERNLGYPLLWSFIVAAAYAPYMAFLLLTGKVHGLNGVYPFGLDDPVGTLRTLSHIAHFLAVLTGVGTVLGAYHAALALWDRRTAVLGALFVTLAYPMFFYARTGNVDMPALCFTALALAVYARILGGGFDAPRAAWLGLWVGCAAATKETTAASFLALPVVLLAMHWRACGTAWRTRSFWAAPLAATAAAALAYGVGSGLFEDPERWRAHIAFISGRLNDTATGNVSYFHNYPNTLAGHVGLVALILSLLAASLTLPGLLLAAAGILRAARDRRAALFVLPALTYALVLFVSVRGAYLRYLLPVTFTLALFAARATRDGLAARWRGVRLATAAIAGVALVLSLVRGADLTVSMLTDSRYAAAAWLARHAQPGDQVEYFGPPNKLPALPDGVTPVRTVEFRGAVFKPRVDDAAAAEIRALWAARRPRFILIMPDHSSPAGAPYSGTMPPAIYDDLMGARLGYALAAELSDRRLFAWARRPPLDYPMVSPPIHLFVRAEPSGSR